MNITQEFNGNTNKPYLRFIGDVHGQIEDYLILASQAEYSIQVGDLGFHYDALPRFLDSSKHKVIGGNHDNYEEFEGRFVKQPPHFLGDFGVYTVPDFGDIFFVRGGASIDKGMRTEGLDWWPGEQMSYSQGLKALEMYNEVKPRIVVSHECPSSIIDLVSGIRTWDGVPIRPSMTANLLESMFESHQPELWIFGHHHKDFFMTLRGTAFRCVNILKCVDLDRKTEDK